MVTKFLTYTRFGRLVPPVIDALPRQLRALLCLGSLRQLPRLARYASLSMSRQRLTPRAIWWQPNELHKSSLRGCAGHQARTTGFGNGGRRTSASIDDRLLTFVSLAPGLASDVQTHAQKCLTVRDAIDHGRSRLQTAALNSNVDEHLATCSRSPARLFSFFDERRKDQQLLRV